MQRLILSTLVASLAAVAAAQTVVAPTGTATTEGASSTAYAWGRGSSQIRAQYIFDSTHFTGQGITCPILINQLQFRANGAATTAGYTYNNAYVAMSTAAVDYLTPSTTFASNHGPNLATVYAGPVVVASGAGTTPNNWYVTIPCTPFLYDPTLGGDLCLELAHDGTGPTTTTGPSHDAMSTGSLTSRIYNLTSWTSATGSTQQNVGVVTEFGYTPASGLYAGFTATPTSGISPLTVNFTDRSFSSSPGGVLAWAWDLDGDGTIDSTVQNPTWIYGCGTFNVSLTVFDSTFPPSTMTKTAYIVVDVIAANFNASPLGGFAPVTVNFTDASTGAVTGWAWDLDGDGTVDSTLQNPSFFYGASGQYTVSLTVANSCRTHTLTRTNLITVLLPGQVPAPPEILQYQFNETSGQDVANTATTNVMPSHGLVTGANWYDDPGRPGFKGNEAGFGCLGDSNNVTATNLVSTTSPLNYSGNMTYSWWQRLVVAPPSTSYAFGGTGSGRIFTGGVAGLSLSYRGALGAINANGAYNVQNNPGVWEHVCLVIDAAAGVATWYFNGVPDTVTAFTPNTHVVAHPLATVGYNGTATTTNYTRNYDMDDFRIYSRALLSIEVQLCALLGEHSSAGTYGTSCAGPGGTPVISGNGVPTLGNAGYAVQLGNAEDNKLAAIVFGYTPAAFGSLSVDPWLTGPGCALQTNNIGIGIHMTASNSASQPFAIPNFAGLKGAHIYTQWLVLGTQGAVTRLLDSNIGE